MKMNWIHILTSTKHRYLVMNREWSIIHVVVYVVFVGKKLGIFLPLIPLVSYLSLLLVFIHSNLWFLTFYSFLQAVVVHQRFVEFFHIDRKLVNQRPFLIESIAIRPDLIDMGVKLAGWPIDSVAEIGLNGGQVHRFFDDIEVIKNPVPLWVHWEEEGERTFVLLELTHDIIALGKFVLDWDFSGSLFPHLQRFFLKEFIYFFDPNSLGAALDFLCVFNISRDPRQVLSLYWK